MRFFIMMCLILTGCESSATTITIPKGAPKVEIIGEIDGAVIAQASKVRKLAKAGVSEIHMLINSPGGAVMPGMVFIDAMKAAQAQGVKFKCYTTVMSASMAYVILSQCDERYAFENARLLFHPMSISTRGSRVQEIATELAQTQKEEEILMAKLREDLKLDWKTFHTNYFAETFWQAARLKDIAPHFLEIIVDVDGFETDIYIFEKPKSLFDFILPATNTILTRFKGIMEGTNAN